MLVVQMLLPRFLVLEVLVLTHVLQQGSACNQKILMDSMDVVRDVLGEKDNKTVKAEEDTLMINQTRLGDCQVQFGGEGVEMPRYLPFFESSSGDLLMPSKSPGHRDRWVLAFSSSEDVRAMCPGAKLKVTEYSSASIRCVGGGQFNLGSGDDDERVVGFVELSCSRSIREKVQKTGDPCGPGDKEGKVAHIGWKTHSGFRKQITVCHDEQKEHTHFAFHVIKGGAIGGRNVEAGRPSFKEGGFYKKSSADKSYKLKTQKATLQTVLGDAKGSRIFSPTTSFLAKGHLAPDADFVFKEGQDATYYFVNAAPQWQSFNNGNWKAIEIAVRDYASRTGSDLMVYTGTLGHLALTDDKGEKKKLYLAKERGQFSLIPVPEFYWKIVHNPITDEAVVFVGLNNPYFEGDPSTEAQICPDQCVSARWFFGYQKNVDKGYIYCCSYLDFKAAVDWVPDIGDGNPTLMHNVLLPLD